MRSSAEVTRAAITSERWHALAIDAAASALATDPRQGLRSEEAARRLAADGPNELQRAAAVSRFAILARHFASLVVWVLIGAALASALLGELVGGGAILAIVALNALLGLSQELRAERAGASLARLAAPRARVVRDGASAFDSARDVVRGHRVRRVRSSSQPAWRPRSVASLGCSRAPGTARLPSSIGSTAWPG